MRSKDARPEGAEPFLLLAPGLVLLLVAFFFPLAQILALAVQERLPDGSTAYGLASFRRLVVDAYYLGVAERTFRLSLLITLISSLIGFPLAYLVARARPGLKVLLLVLTILPLMTSVVIRTFGWLVILGRGGLLPDLLFRLGLAGRAFALMHTETGIVIAMVQVLLPFTVLTTMGAIGRIDPRLEEAARSMGAGFFTTLFRITLPLSLPGLLSGALLVFALSISSFITPQLIGGVRLPVMATSIYQQMTATLDWPFAAAQSVVLLAAVLLVITPTVRLAGGRRG